MITADDIKTTLRDTRSMMMGIAILMVILYHAVCSNLPMGLLTIPATYGLIDIFLFLSAYGLCYSLQNKNLREFYGRRFMRILPIYVILVFSMLIINMIRIGALDIVGACTTTFFWGVGDVFVDWYLTALLYLYLLFPLFYKLINKFGLAILLIISALALCYVWYIPHPWFHESAMCRIPIFLSGIYFCRSRHSILSVILLSAIFAALCIFSFFTGKVCLTYYLAPFVSVGILLFCKVCWKLTVLSTPLSFIGKYTLELYVANCIVMELMKFVPNHGIIGYMFYFIGTFLLGAILCLLLGYLKGG